MVCQLLLRMIRSRQKTEHGSSVTLALNLQTIANEIPAGRSVLRSLVRPNKEKLHQSPIDYRPTNVCGTRAPINLELQARALCRRTRKLYFQRIARDLNTCVLVLLE